MEWEAEMIWFGRQCMLCGVTYRQAANCMRGIHADGSTYCEGCDYVISRSEVVDPDEERTGRSREAAAR